jgi:hypothetical protein
MKRIALNPGVVGTPDQELKRLARMGADYTRDEAWTLKMKPSIVHSGKKSSSSIAKEEAKIDAKEVKANEDQGFNKSFIQTKSEGKKTKKQAEKSENSSDDDSSDSDSDDE